jgi:hypothetical protein
VSEPSASELRTTVDEVAIRGLIAAYADVVNRRIWAELDELFLADAPVVLDLRDRAPMEFVGPAALGAFIERALEQYPFFEFVALNVRVLLELDDDPERARVRTYMCELRQDHAGTPSRAYGIYQDDVLRTATGWRFARRHYQSIGRGEQGLDLKPPPAIL